MILGLITRSNDKSGKDEEPPAVVTGNALDEGSNRYAGRGSAPRSDDNDAGMVGVDEPREARGG